MAETELRLSPLLMTVHQHANPTPTPTGLDVTILMPCLNEIRTLPQCIEWAQEALAELKRAHGLSGEVLISDNGSEDGSVELATSLGARVVSCPQRGYGAALRYGALSARGRYLVMGDSDASYDFRDSVAMVEKLTEGYELCMGSRFKGKIMPGAMPWKNQHIGNPALTGVLNLFFRSGLSDAHCGLRAFTKEAFIKIDPNSPGMEFASEMVIKATLLNCKRTEVPIVLHPDGRDRPPHLNPLRDGWRHLRYIIMLSPAWLYLVPGLLLLGTGILIIAALVGTEPGQVFALGPLWFGDHWLPVAMGMTVSGHLAVLFALAATLVGIRGGYRQATPLMALLYRLSRLENLLLTALILMLLGSGIIARVVFSWANADFGALGMQRHMVAGATALVLGVQSAFGAFLLSVIAGNDAEPEESVKQAVSQRAPQLLSGR